MKGSTISLIAVMLVLSPLSPLMLFAQVSNPNNEEAVRKLRQLLDNIEPHKVLSVVDEVLCLTGELELRGFAEDAREYERKLIDLLERDSQYGRVPYQILQKAYYRGQNIFLIDYGREVNDLNWQSHSLAAKAYADEFLRYRSTEMRKMLTPQERSEKLGRLARMCTEHYEAAVSRVSDQYVKTQLAYEWLALKGYNFPSDSLLIKRQFPTHPLFQCGASKESISEQAERIRVVTHDAIESGRQGKLFAQETRTEIVRSFVEEFKVYAQIGIPDHALNCIVRDIPFFFDIGMPMNLITESNTSRLRELEDMFKWYLWQAIILPIPDEYEQEQIEVQIDRITEHCRNTLADVNMPDEYSACLESYIMKWLAQYDKLGHNRFVPYFKRVLSRYRFSNVMSLLTKNLTEVNKDLDGYTEAVKRLKHDLAEEQVTDVWKAHGFAALVQILADYARYDRPTATHLPNKIFRQDLGTINKYYVCAFIPGEGHPF
jgi:hypothetical protein